MNGRKVSVETIALGSSVSVHDPTWFAHAKCAGGAHVVEDCATRKNSARTKPTNAVQLNSIMIRSSVQKPGTMIAEPG